MFTRSLTVLGAVLIAALATSCTATNDEALPKDPVPSTTELTSAWVAIQMNHCFVEPVSFDGEQWNVPFQRQFGWGGLQPKRWQGVGTMQRVNEDMARFQDEGGAVVVFRPVDHPTVRRVEKALCD
jgi:hypothetical protein